MATEMEMLQARDAYTKICAMLDANKWHYDKDADNLSIKCGATGNDLPIDIRIQVDPDKQLVTLLSQMPYSVPEDDRVLMAVAVCAANYNMVDGSFDYNLSNGNIIFRMTTSIRESIISKDVFEYMLFVSCSTVDEYNDKFLMLIKKAMTLEEFMKATKE